MALRKCVPLSVGLHANRAVGRLDGQRFWKIVQEVLSSVER